MWPERIGFPALCAVQLALVPARLPAQQLSHLPDLSGLSATLDQEIAARFHPGEPDSVRKIKKTYWVEGALIGGATVGVLFAALAGGFCGDSDSNTAGGPCWDNVLLGALVGFGTGGSLGALIGGQFNKAEENPEESRREAEIRE
jgi:hypothetical protein